MKGRLIAFAGAAGAGKDTAAAPLIAAGFKLVRFADPLKDALAALLGISREKLEDRVFKESVLPAIEKSPRELMQTLGTEWGRGMVHPNLWVLLAMHAVDQQLQAGHSVVMTDCRFGNEAHAVRSRGGLVVKIVRDAPSTAPAHASEKGLDIGHCDLVLQNDNSTPERFSARVAAVLGVVPVKRATDMHDSSRYPQELIDEAMRDADEMHGRRGFADGP